MLINSFGQYVTLEFISPIASKSWQTSVYHLHRQKAMSSLILLPVIPPML
ncbi:hypothetical protein PHET_08794 [Paragonimus heterotremus]|uniref:Uncharacterized protein n=1 Tax=Paragonimus heterotremus TaxID=100268 RepID=A0A8J4SNT0_9TREM|nr:hypothetical protein PHET_08794 [Paragonimus heterotremus]